jgi:hypothetical protein
MKHMRWKDSHHSNPNHRCEQLLTGWRWEAWRVDDDKWPSTCPSPASHCSQGGLWVLTATSPPMMGEMNTKWPTPKHHSQTPLLCCKPLLAGWLGGTAGRWHRGTTNNKCGTSNIEHWTLNGECRTSNVEQWMTNGNPPSRKMWGRVLFH